MTSDPRQQRLLLGLTVCVSVVLGLVLAEILVRIVGNHPVLVEPRRHPGEPTTNLPDPVLGWRAKPGNYRYPGYTPEAPPITLTIWPDGARATGPRLVPRDRRVVLIGDSFTQGWAVSDDETFGWKLQARLPAVEIVNLGTPGYNGVQALLRLEEHLNHRPQAPDVVVYGLNDDQERRNVAEATWLGVLAISPNREMIRLPYALLASDGRLVLHPPEGFPLWPLREHFALVALLENATFKLATRGRPAQQRAVTERLLERMDRVVATRGGRFLVALLAGPLELATHYADYTRSAGLAFVDCRLHGGAYGEFIVAGEGHPNGRAHTLWSECLGRALDHELMVAPPRG